MCRISSGYQPEGNGSGHCHTSPCCADLEHYYLLRKPQIGLTLDCLAPNNYPGDNSGQHQHHTERFGFERVAGNDADDGETVGLLYRGWFGRGSSCCIGNLCPLDGQGGGDGLSANP